MMIMTILNLYRDISYIFLKTSTYVGLSNIVQLLLMLFINSMHLQSRIPFSWNMALYHWVTGSQHFVETWCLYIQGSKCPRRFLPEEWNPELHCCESVKNHIRYTSWYTPNCNFWRCHNKSRPNKINTNMHTSTMLWPYLIIGSHVLY